MAVQRPDQLESSRHSAAVRLTHWITALAALALLISGIAILLAHPRLYWGEAGGLGAPSLLDLPLPFVITGQTGWGRSLHFLSAWICILTGLVYVPSLLLSRHYGRYNSLQRLTYLAVVFALFPLIIWTGLAMSPAITSVFPILVTVFGGQQSARTLHFFLATFLVLFLLVHVTMVYRAGFTTLVRAMLIGTKPTGVSR